MNRKNICIRQRDSTDCGPACIVSVMAHYDERVPVARVRQIASTDKHGTSMWGMVKTLEQFGYSARGMKGPVEYLDKLPLPFIAHIQQENGLQHYVCVYGITRKGVMVMDPARGKIERRSFDYFEKQWSGAVIVIVKGIQVEKLLSKIPSRPDLISLLRPVWKPLMQAFFCAVIYTLLGLSTSIYIGKLTDHVFLSHNTGLLNLMSSVMVMVTFLLIYLFVIKSVIVLKTGQIIDNQLIISYYRHLFRLPQRFFDTMKTGEIISRINDAVKIRGFINDSVIGIMVNILILIFSFATMFVLYWKLSLIMLGILPFYTFIYILFNHRNRQIERRAMEHTAIFENQLVESLQSSTHIRQHNLDSFSREKSESGLNRLLDTLYKSGLNSIAAMGGTEMINRLFTVILLWTGSWFVIQQAITPGKLLTFYALIGYFTGPVSGLIGANKSYQNAIIAADRLFEIFQLEPEQKTGKPVFSRDNFGDIVLNNVSFSYGNRRSLIRKLDLVVEEGKLTVITGASGSGKSTVAALIQQLYPVNEGIISINGCDTRYFSSDSIRSLMGVVPQQVRFLNGTLLENIAPGDINPDLKKITDLISRAGLSALVESLPEGIESHLTENGANLSGGERQKLAIVRALYRDPSLLILDEATSSMDPVSEREVNRLVLDLRNQSQTILLISHKEQNISISDTAFIMDKGQVTGICH